LGRVQGVANRPIVGYGHLVAVKEQLPLLKFCIGWVFLLAVDHAADPDPGALQPFLVRWFGVCFVVRLLCRLLGLLRRPFAAPPALGRPASAPPATYVVDPVPPPAPGRPPAVPPGRRRRRHCRPALKRSAALLSPASASPTTLTSTRGASARRLRRKRRGPP